MLNGADQEENSKQQVASTSKCTLHIAVCQEIIVNTGCSLFTTKGS